MNPESRKILPDAAFRGFASRYQAPKIDEGFQEVVAVDFEVGQSTGSEWGSLTRRFSSKARTSNAKCGADTGYEACCIR